MTSLGNCGFRQASECACPTDRCAVQPPKARAPLPIPSVKDTLMTAAFIGAVAFIISFAIAARAEPHFKIQDQINQEIVRNGR